MTRHRRASTWALLLMVAGLHLNAQHDRRDEAARPERPREGRPQAERGQERGQERGREAPVRSAQAPRERGFEERPRPEQPRRGEPERLRRAEEVRPRPEPRPERRESAVPRGAPPTRDLGRPVRPEAARAWQARESWRRDAWPARPSWREHRAHRWESEHRTWAQRGGYGGYRIPEPQFVARFGDRHAFRIGSRPVIYRGYPRFRCGGYWFLIVDPWPEFWADEWYLWDDMYIDDAFDGYYLTSRRHPGIRLAIMVSL